MEFLLSNIEAEQIPAKIFPFFSRPDRFRLRRSPSACRSNRERRDPPTTALLKGIVWRRALCEARQFEECRVFCLRRWRPTRCSWVLRTATASCWANPPFAKRVWLELEKCAAMLTASHRRPAKCIRRERFPERDHSWSSRRSSSMPSISAARGAFPEPIGGRNHARKDAPSLHGIFRWIFPHSNSYSPGWSWRSLEPGSRSNLSTRWSSSQTWFLVAVGSGKCFNRPRCSGSKLCSLARHITQCKSVKSGQPIRLRVSVCVSATKKRAF